MTDDEINEAITEATGLWDYPYSSETKRMYDFCSDLNAMHEAEKTLRTTDSHEYANMLYDIACKNQEQNGKWLPYSISARQRAEAFLRTLGKWEEVQK